MEMQTLFWIVIHPVKQQRKRGWIDTAEKLAISVLVNINNCEALNNETKVNFINY